MNNVRELIAVVLVGASSAFAQTVCTFGGTLDGYFNNNPPTPTSGCGFDFDGDDGDMDGDDFKHLWEDLKSEFDTDCPSHGPLGPQDLRDTLDRLNDENDLLSPSDCDLCSGEIASAYTSIMYEEWGIIPTPEDLSDLDGEGACEPPIDDGPFPGDGSPQPIICSGTSPCDVQGLLPGGDDMCPSGGTCNYDHICLGVDCPDADDLNLLDPKNQITVPVEIPAIGDPKVPPSWIDDEEDEDYGSPPMLLPPDEDENRPNPPGEKTWEPKPTDGKDAAPDPVPPTAWVIGASNGDGGDTDEGGESSCASDSGSGGDRRASGGGGNLRSLYPGSLWPYPRRRCTRTTCTTRQRLIWRTGTTRTSMANARSSPRGFRSINKGPTVDDFTALRSALQAPSAATDNERTVRFWCPVSPRSIPFALSVDAVDTRIEMRERGAALSVIPSMVGGVATAIPLLLLANDA